MEEEELVFELVLDPELRQTMEDPLFTDFYLMIGEEKYMFPVNLTFLSLFSLRMREHFKNLRNKRMILDKVEYLEISSKDFTIMQRIFTRGRITLERRDILPALRVASFFQVPTLMNFLIDRIKRNESLLDELDLFLFSVESTSESLFKLACMRVKLMGEELFLSDKLAAEFTEKNMKQLLSRRV